MACQGRCFNGAATFRPRKVGTEKAGKLPLKRFNGAATFRPRKARRRAHHAPRVLASMGPRPFGRGRRFCGLAIISDTRSFNGAATFRPRKGRHRRAPPSFVKELQWGRDLSAAEGCRLRMTSSANVGLQWGRDLSAAEGLSAARLKTRRYSFNGAATFRPRKAAERAGRRWLGMLQWGRDLSAAEGPTRRSTSRPTTFSFNGAATFRPRKAAPAPDLHVPHHALQWGRDLSAAEGMTRYGHDPFNRKLQWGRDLSAAEGCHRPLNLAEAGQLQWGRDLSAAEGTTSGCPA